MSALKHSVLRDIATNLCKTSVKGCGRGKKGVADLVSNIVASGEVAKGHTAPKPKKTRGRKQTTRTRSRSRSKTKQKKKK